MNKFVTLQILWYIKYNDILTVRLLCLNNK